MGRTSFVYACHREYGTRVANVTSTLETAVAVTSARVVE
jgi:hypothetical protein